MARSDTAYCLRCKEKVSVSSPRKEMVESSKRVVHMLRGKCPHCGTKVSKILPG